MKIWSAFAVVGLFVAGLTACGGDDEGDGSSGTGTAGGGQGGSGSGGEATSSGGAGGSGGGSGGSATGGNGSGGGGGSMANGVSMACQTCLMTSCLNEMNACAAEPECRDCILTDYTAASCDANANWQTLIGCACGMGNAGPCAADCPCN